MSYKIFILNTNVLLVVWTVCFSFELWTMHSYFKFEKSSEQKRNSHRDEWTDWNGSIFLFARIENYIWSEDQIFNLDISFNHRSNFLKTFRRKLNQSLPPRVFWTGSAQYWLTINFRISNLSAFNILYFSKSIFDFPLFSFALKWPFLCHPFPSIVIDSFLELTFLMMVSSRISSISET